MSRLCALDPDGPKGDRGQWQTYARGEVATFGLTTSYQNRAVLTWPLGCCWPLSDRVLTPLQQTIGERPT